jgi:CRP/FNR family transcriptional regulator, anaerobic regulatory protein
MLSTLYDYMKNIHPIDAEITDALDSSFDIVEVPKRHVLLKEGETCHYLYLVLDGLVRIYHVEEDEEVSSLFVEEKYLFNSPHSFYMQRPGYEYMETLEPTTLARIHYNDLQRLYKTYPELNFIARVITENYFLKTSERLYLLRKKTAEERYRYFIDRYPSLLQRVPLKYIATYLGITMETLSRIRNKIRK